MSGVDGKVAAARCLVSYRSASEGVAIVWRFLALLWPLRAKDAISGSCVKMIAIGGLGFPRPSIDINPWRGTEMTTEHVDLNQFIVDRLDAAYRWIERLSEDVTDEQFYFQPKADCNSIAWLVWHLSRWRDRTSSNISGEAEVWISEGWAQRFGMDAERTGLGDTPEQVAAFRVPRDQVLGYAEAAHRAIVQRVSKLTPEQFEQPVAYSPGNLRPAWQVLAGVIGDSTEHVGQINYLRGMTAGLGWR